MALGLALALIFHLPATIRTLVGAGTAIYGSSAILALGPLVRAKDEEIAYAITTIFTLNIVALLLYPPLGHLLHLSSTAFGSWTGTAVNDTSVVLATGFVYSQPAGAVASILKLTADAAVSLRSQAGCWRTAYTMRVLTYIICIVKEMKRRHARLVALARRGLLGHVCWF